MKIVNVTPHPLVIQRPDPSTPLGYTTTTIESSGIARCSTVETLIGDVDGIPVIRTTFGAVEGLPPFRAVCTACANCEDAGEQETGYCRVCGGNIDALQIIYPGSVHRSDGTISRSRVPRIETVYVVSSITAQAVQHRPDVFVPSHPVRDEQGRIVACAALGRIV